MDFKDYLKDKITQVEDGLKKFVPGDKDFPESLNKAMNYSLMAGGKRLRPVLVIATGEALGGDLEELMPTACALECIHTYSLIHDDLPAMDDDDLRRGKPTCHKKFNEATAILAGDGLLTYAFELIAKSDFKDPNTLKDVIIEISKSSGPQGMVGGQLIDLESEGKDLTLKELENVHKHKTGALIRASVRVGAIISKATEKELKALTSYGEKIGLAFQIVDDILDVTGTTEELGKDAGSDVENDKATYPALLGLEESKEKANTQIEEALKELEIFDEKAEPLRALANYIIDRTN